MKNTYSLFKTFCKPFYFVMCIGLALCNLLIGASVKSPTTQPASKQVATTQRATSQPATSQPALPVKSVRDIPRSEILKISSHIDKLIIKNYKKHNVQPNADANKMIMFRRYYLNIIGRIPTYDEIQTFTKNRKPNRRAELIDDLLDSLGYVSNMFNYYADLLRIKSKAERAIGEPYIKWIKQSLRESKPYDLMVYEMLTAQGYVWNNGAVGYYQRDMGMPLDNMSNTTRIFLGTQVGCAQCHDHPFDVWTQMEFHEMSAYTYGVSTTNARWKSPNLEKLYKQLRRKKGVSRADEVPHKEMMRRAARELLEPLQYPVFVRNKTLRLPNDYKYDDAKPKDIVMPRTIFGDLAQVPKGHSRPEVFAKWITSPQNPRFTKVIANRIWKEAFGVGLIEPVDGITQDTKASNPELLDYLIKQMIALNYDIKQFQRVIYNTKTFQRQTSKQQWETGQEYHYPGPTLQRMSAEQIWDSMLTLTIRDIDERQGNVASGRRYNYDKLNEYIKLDVKVLHELVDKRAHAITRKRSFEKAKRPLEQKLRTARKNKKASEVTKLNKQLKKLRSEYSEVVDQYKADRLSRKTKQDRDGDPRWKGVPKDMVRASEMVQPARPGHFLREFGQSDRDIIENAYDDASVPQILTLMNGPIFQRLMRRDSVLVKKVTKAKNGRDKLNAVWLSVLTRKPTASESKLVKSTLKSVKNEQAYTDAVWALLNTREFIFIQ